MCLELIIYRALIKAFLMDNVSALIAIYVTRYRYSHRIHSVYLLFGLVPH